MLSKNAKCIVNPLQVAVPKFANLITFDFSCKPDFVYVSGKVESGETVPVLVYSLKVCIFIGRALSVFYNCINLPAVLIKASLQTPHFREITFLKELKMRGQLWLCSCGFSKDSGPRLSVFPVIKGLQSDLSSSSMLICSPHSLSQSARIGR